MVGGPAGESAGAVVAEEGEDAAAEADPRLRLRERRYGQQGHGESKQHANHPLFLCRKQMYLLRHEEINSKQSGDVAQW